MIDCCEPCMVHSYAQPEESLLMRLPKGPSWKRAGVDLCQHAGKMYLVYDAHSNYPEVEELNSTTALAVISKLSTIFARHGIPLVVLNDNGPQFTSREFMIMTYNMLLSPRFPQSNGLAEEEVQKCTMKKTCCAGGEFYFWTEQSHEATRTTTEALPNLRPGDVVRPRSDLLTCR